MRRLIVLAALALPAGLAACGDTTELDESELQEEAIANDAGDAQLGLQLSQGRVRLPAVDGRPGVAYFDLVSNRDEPVRIVAVEVIGVGEAEMHETKVEDGVTMMASAGSIVLEPREGVRFAPGGFHVMLFDIDPTLAAGDSTDLTVTLENGDKFSTTAQVLGPNEAMSEMDMPGMETVH
ncbi:copper chaperone PCu(A)C [Croceicoccus marinus]|jgi:hypothetical protein|uniref:Copper chaperone PCu(A)C n=1 Tax=Croceicoccus marinus TaxID=450378 RepID=A0A7G6VQF7_9SPHN|nr:copper chaperone PCu(A)C [Croceicoccus marinus]QNE03972.1 copper chaperone PCu(A)C [Croceicoccus marinus]